MMRELNDVFVVLEIWIDSNVFSNIIVVDKILIIKNEIKEFFEDFNKFLVFLNLFLEIFLFIGFVIGESLIDVSLKGNVVVVDDVNLISDKIILIIIDIKFI